MEGELNIVDELRHFIQILANQPCIVEAVSEMGDDMHSICKTWQCLKTNMLQCGKTICGEEAFQVYDENDLIIPKSPMEKYVMTLMLQAMICEVVDPPKSKPADVLDFNTRKKI